MTTAAGLGVVVLTHEAPRHLARMLEALQPAAAAVHCDLATDEATFAEMRRLAPQGTTFVPRRRTPWGSFALVLAELDALRAVLADPSVTHVAVCSGADYPLLSPAGIAAALEGLGGRSAFATFRLPASFWGRRGGLYRFHRPHWCVRGHDLSLPLRRRLPAGIVPAGGSAQKILARQHLEELLAHLDGRPEVLAFFRRVWIADETLLPSLIESTVGVTRPAEIVHEHAWYLDWGGPGHRSPRWLDEADHPRLVAAQAERLASGGIPLLFVRKVADAHSPRLLERLDADRRAALPLPPAREGLTARST